MAQVQTACEGTTRAYLSDYALHSGHLTSVFCPGQRIDAFCVDLKWWVGPEVVHSGGHVSGRKVIFFGFAVSQ